MTEPHVDAELAAFDRYFAWIAAPAPDICPHCGQTPVTKILYGLIRTISKAMEADLQAGTLQLGGCVRTGQSPKWVCRGCGHRECPPAEVLP